MLVPGEGGAGMQMLAWIFYSLAAVIIGFGIVVVLTVPDGVMRLLPYLLFLTAVPAAIGYGLDRWARNREQPQHR